MSEEAVLLERRGQVAWITLNRPEAMNAIDQGIRETLPGRLAEAEADPDIRALVVAGAGERAFCAGADVKGFGLEPSMIESRRERLDGHWAYAFDRVRKPIIAAIHGYCLGGGLEIALACDIRIAAEDAQIGLPEVTHGVIPGAGGTQRLARVIGVGRALDVILSAERLSARRAFDLGIVTRIVPRAELHATAQALAERIAGFPPVAVRYAKEAVTRGFELPLPSGLTLELDLAMLLHSTEDRKEAGRAFREKRKPVFTGR